MMKRNILQIILIATAILPVYSQTEPGNFKVSSKRIVKESSRVSVSMEIDLEAMNVNRNDMVILTPILKSNDNDAETLSLPPVVIAGSLRNKIIKRKEKLGDELPFETEPQVVVKRKNKTSQQVSYQTSIPYRQWMGDASLIVSPAVSGCANCYDQAGDQLIVQNIFPQQNVASYKLTYIVPEVEPVKARSDRHTATFNYIVDRYNLLRDYKNNQVQFDQVDKIIGDIQANTNLQITEFAIAGYASPEGGFEHNRILAKNRANSFANYLIEKFNVAPNKFTVTSSGEDWGGLRKAVAASSLADREAILDIIDKTKDPDARDAELISLSAGETYKTLLNSYYPALRRTEYVVAYVVRAFNVEEAKEIIKTNPKLLSLNEMYLVAESYVPNSKEFKEVFDIATRLYPESDLAIINSASVDIEGKNYDAAIERLMKIATKSKAWNNLGVAYILKGDVQEALEYFTKSAESGDADGQANLKTLEAANQK